MYLHAFFVVWVESQIAGYLQKNSFLFYHLLWCFLLDFPRDFFPFFGKNFLASAC